MAEERDENEGGGREAEKQKMEEYEDGEKGRKEGIMIMTVMAKTTKMILFL